jgi:hypothetical protein
MLGATGTQVEQKLDQAWELLGRDGPQDHVQQLGAILTPDTLKLCSAVCYTEAGQARWPPTCSSSTCHRTISALS